MHTIKQQLQENFIAIISLVVAIVALYHNERLYEKSEHNRNIRIAAFEILMRLGELQQAVNTIHFDNSPSGTVMQAWGKIALVADLSSVVPEPVPKTTKELIDAWKENYQKLKEESAADAISEHIDKTRQAVLAVISGLG